MKGDRPGNGPVQTSPNISNRKTSSRERRFETAREKTAKFIECRRAYQSLFVAFTAVKAKKDPPQRYIRRGVFPEAKV
jgi:hypothetical protein